MKKLASIAVTAVLLATAPAQADGTKELIGTLLGGAAGGFAGSHVGKGTGRLAATAGGAVLGAMVGNGVGSSLDRADRMYGGYPTRSYAPPPVVYAPAPPVYVERRTYYYQPAPVYYERPHRPHWRAHRQPQVIYQPVQQQHCREYQSEVAVGGYAQAGYGTACLQPDGSWQIVR